MTKALVGLALMTSFFVPTFVVHAATESPTNAVVFAGETASITDASGASWKIRSGIVKRNGKKAGYSARVIAIAYVNHVVWQENADKLWWSWNGKSWDGGSGTATSPLSTASVASDNPFVGKSLFTVSSSHALTQASSWLSSQPTNASKMAYLGTQPTAVWFGDWNSDVERDARQYVDGAEAAARLPVLVAYAIPNRDCGSGYSAGGVHDASDYHDWITKLANGIGSRSAIVILEPDAVALDCFTSSRAAMLRDAVAVLEAKPSVSVYIDAGHPNWTSASTTATRLKDAGIENAQGFALNVANFYSTSSNVTFGDELSTKVGGKHYVIDTSRNANGWQGEWCNPQGAGIGAAPTVNTGESFVDAFLWIKPPGESDGTCNGGPSAGAWWSSYAVKLYDQGKH